jgi:RNA polymerase sigma-70 factor (ECF subfamily)
VYRVTGSAIDADDIVQESFCRLLTVQPPGESEEDLRRYLFRVAGNLMIDRWRRLGRDQLLRADRVPPVETVADAPLAHDVSRMFAKLRPKDRALLWLAYVEEADHAEIARTLGLSRPSVRVVLSRARARLRELLKSQRL